MYGRSRFVCVKVLSLGVEHETAVALIRGGVGLDTPGTPTRGGTWADLGAGSGVFTRALASLLGPTGTVYAIDRDRRAAQHLDARSGPVSGATIQVRQADFTRPLELDPLDGLLLANALHFAPQQERVLRRLVGHVKHHGRLVVVEYDTHRRTPWGPFPVPLERLGQLTRAVGLTEFREVGRQPSSFGGRELYAAVAVKP
jgi:ubiquinone/menaquinone biosynthesis C-methylase UbiE